MRAKDKEELTLGVLFSNTISNYFSVDARFFKSFWPLMAKPGYLAKRFLEGKRLLYLHPAQMYLFISVVFFFLFSFVARKQEQQIDQALQKDLQEVKTPLDTTYKPEIDTVKINKLINAYVDNKQAANLNNDVLNSVNNKTNENSSISLFEGGEQMDSLFNAGVSDADILKEMGLKADDGYFKKRLYAQILKFHKNRSGGSVLKAFYDSLPIAMFFLLPLFALILKLLYFKRGSYAHHLVFSFYFFSYLFVVFTTLVLASLIWPNFPDWIMTLIILSVFFYLMIALKKFYNQSWFVSYIKASLSASIFGVLVSVSTFLLIMFALLYY